MQTARVRGAWLSEAFREGTTAAAVAENFGPELIASYGPEPTASWFVDGVDRSGWSEMAVSAGATEAVGDGGFVVRVLADREWFLQFRLEDAPPYRIAWFRPTSLPPGSIKWGSVARRLAGLDWAESSLDPVDGDAIHGALVAARDDQAVVGMLFAAARDGRCVHFEALGSPDLATPAPLTRGQRFRAGSITKPITAFAVVELARRGLVELDAAANDHLRRVRVAGDPRWPPPSVADLLTHTAGLSRNLPAADAEPGVDGLPSQVAALRAPGMPLYSNVGYGILGVLIEDVTGAAFPDWVRDHILGPLGLDNTTIDAFPPDTWTGYTSAAGRVAAVAPARVAHIAAGAVTTTIDDLLNLGVIMAAQQHPLARAVLEIRTPGDDGDDFALGWRVSPNPPTAVGHTGSLHGAGATVVAVPEAAIAVAMATNCAPHPAFSTARRQIRQILGTR